MRRPTRRWPQHACPVYLIYPWPPLCVEWHRGEIAQLYREDGAHMTEGEFTELLAREGTDILHAFAAVIYDAAWADGSDTTPGYQVGPRLGRFLLEIASEHGERHAARQRTEAPAWLRRLQGPE